MAVRCPTLVGRDGDLDVLRDAWARAATGEPRIVVIRGEAGIGKTRLIEELTETARDGGGRLLLGGGVPLVNGDLPFAPLDEALRPLGGAGARSTASEASGDGQGRV